MNIAEALSKGIARVAKDHYKEKKAEERGQRAYRSWSRPRRSVKDAVFAAMPEAIRLASGGGTLPFAVRQLFYQVRPLIQGASDRELDYAYFTPSLVAAYEEDYGPIPGILYDARGTFQEPHEDGQRVAMGTSGVAAYTLPDYTFNKVLYVEKEGFDGVFKAAKLGERYDLAIMYGKGYAVRAAKELLALASDQDISVLVLHDCDIDGYEIARTLGEATRTAPDHYIDLIDIGLSVADVEEMDLQTEYAYRRRQPSYEFRHRLTAKERQFFLDTSRRTELNALTAPQLVAFVERKLEEHGIDDKVVPPEERVGEAFLATSRDEMQVAADALVKEAIANLCGVDDLNALAVELLLKDYAAPSDLRERMSEELHNGRRQDSWRAFVNGEAGERVKEWVDECRETMLADLAGRLQGNKEAT